MFIVKGKSYIAFPELFERSEGKILSLRVYSTVKLDSQETLALKVTLKAASKVTLKVKQMCSKRILIHQNLKEKSLSSFSCLMKVKFIFFMSSCIERVSECKLTHMKTKNVCDIFH